MNNFKEYGFEADFEGAILSDIEDYYVGYYVESYLCIKEKQKIPTFWNKNTGNCYKGAGVSNSKFSLKPIKKEWYENSDNIGKVLRAINKDTRLDELCIFKSKEDNTITATGLDGYDFIDFFSTFRPATKEEVVEKDDKAEEIAKIIKEEIEKRFADSTKQISKIQDAYDNVAGVLGMTFNKNGMNEDAIYSFGYESLTGEKLDKFMDSKTAFNIVASKHKKPSNTFKDSKTVDSKLSSVLSRFN